MLVSGRVLTMVIKLLTTYESWDGPPSMSFPLRFHPTCVWQVGTGPTMFAYGASATRYEPSGIQIWDGKDGAPK